MAIAPSPDPSVRCSRKQETRERSECASGSGMFNGRGIASGSASLPFHEVAQPFLSGLPLAVFCLGDDRFQGGENSFRDSGCIMQSLQ